VLNSAGRGPLAAFLAEHDIVVNCILQDTDRPRDRVGVGPGRRQPSEEPRLRCHPLEPLPHQF
jgi:hypothetical protein